jgi:undecaprenyl-diphosphatase
VLGALQGVTEFLPISSDGHLAIARGLLGVSDDSLAGTVLLHFGTLLATIFVLRADVRRSVEAVVDSVRTRDVSGVWAREVLAVVVASIPTAIIGLAFEPHVAEWSADMRIVGVCLLISAIFVGASHRFRTGTADVLPLRSAFFVGVIQGLAVLPGWSRSGSTIALAMALGLAPLAAMRFSFLLSLPAVAGACLLELRHPEIWTTLDGASALGALVALVTGAVALSSLRGVITSGRFAWFAPYLVVLGLGLLFTSTQG